MSDHDYLGDDDDDDFPGTCVFYQGPTRERSWVRVVGPCSNTSGFYSLFEVVDGALVSEPAHQHFAGASVHGPWIEVPCPSIEDQT